MPSYLRDLEILVYNGIDTASWSIESVPGFDIARVMDEIGPNADLDHLADKVNSSCRKLAMAQFAISKYYVCEKEIYATTFRDAMAWFGSQQIEANFYLESTVLFFRAALDIGSSLFSVLLPDPIQRQRLDSFNDLTKKVAKSQADLELITKCKQLREGKERWFSWVVGTERGRSLRDKLVHQTEFPLTSCELSASSEREDIVVNIENEFILTNIFLTELAQGVFKIYADFEHEAAQYLSSSRLG